MTWSLRFILSFITLIIALFFGAFGGFFSNLLQRLTRFPLVALPLILIAAFLLLPWKELIFSQEELEKNIDDLIESLEETQKMIPQLQELRKEIEEKGGLPQKELDEMIARFQDIRTPSEKATKTLREMLFGEHRRMIVVLVIILFIAGAGGSLLVNYFSQLFS